mmetsp:Transcript_29617/g.92120  ORF Transcript_29617/g.92120 Transcript_29617/m.92120 type:complete len:177 (-) Transcript_29617:8-538(-)
MLRQDYHEELVRVSLRRDRCASLGSGALCAGECQWQVSAAAPGGRCTLRSADALLSVTGEDCPLRPLLRRHAACRESSSLACSARNPECYWDGRRCLGHPMTLELDLLALLGLDQPEILGKMQAASAACTAHLSSPFTCNSVCERAAPSAAPARRGTWAAPLLLLLSSRALAPVAG